MLSLINNKASIVQGPPGTGKSETIANLLCHLAATGKKVLFVSQKTQALKVVKDKLKKLDIKYLFGYVPNPRLNTNYRRRRNWWNYIITNLKKNLGSYSVIFKKPF